MLTYNKTITNALGLHIAFSTPITEANFIEACEMAIRLAKMQCGAENVVAINFEADGVPIQVVECDDAIVQCALWKSRMKHRGESARDTLDDATAEFTRSDQIKAEYLGSGQQASDLNSAIERLLLECASLFGSEADAMAFLMLETNADECAIELTGEGLSGKQLAAMKDLSVALAQATGCGLFDAMAADVSHPDRINAFCDDFDIFVKRNATT